VVNAAGIWARDVAKMAGVEVPRRRRAPVHDHRKEQFNPDRPADSARSRQHLLSQARAGALAVGGWEKVRRLSAPRASPSRSAASCSSQPRQAGSLPAAGARAPADPERARHPHLINGRSRSRPTATDHGFGPERDNSTSPAASPSGIAASGGAGKAIGEGSSRASPGSIYGRSTCAASAVIT